MKTNLTTLSLLFYFCSFAQVGIGTTDPTKDLDVNGELRVRNLPPITSNEFLVSDPEGNVGSTTLIINLPNFQRIVLPSPVTTIVDTNTTGVYFDNDIDIQMFVTAVVSPGQRAYIKVLYSVPISNSGESVGDIGIFFQRNGVTQLLSSRSESAGVSNYIACIFYEYVDNRNGSTPVSVLYELRGYINQTSSDAEGSYFFGLLPDGIGFISLEMRSY